MIVNQDGGERERVEIESGDEGARKSWKKGRYQREKRIIEKRGVVEKSVLWNVVQWKKRV